MLPRSPSVWFSAVVVRSWNPGNPARCRMLLIGSVSKWAFPVKRPPSDGCLIPEGQSALSFGDQVWTPIRSSPMARAYDVVEIEKKWQRRWADECTYEVDADDPRPPWYVLTMYPYPSGPAHMGHVRNYTFGDLLVRHRTMLGYAVLSPFGFDSFGLRAENAAIKTGTHPRIFTDARIVKLKESITSLGAVYDWRREIHSHDPEYIKWNQVIFQKLLADDLAYRAYAPVNWCPGCQTVLANEQVLADGTC